MNYIDYKGTPPGNWIILGCTILYFLFVVLFLPVAHYMVAWGLGIAFLSLICAIVELDREDRDDPIF